jgi:glutathione S-transferase
MKLVLHSAKRASAPYRVRIGLNLKGLSYDLRPVDLVANAHQGADYRALNAQALVPTLEVDGRRLTQSLAILEWLDEVMPEPACCRPRRSSAPSCAAWPRSSPATSTR